MKRLPAVLWAGVMVVGCSSARGGAIFVRPERPRVMAAPKHDRCEALLGSRATFQQCSEFKQAAIDYIHKLSTGDQICLENGFGEEPREGCKARAFILDADSRGLTTEVRYPSLDSRWREMNEQKVYFENGALVDLYLRERGYE